MNENDFWNYVRRARGQPEKTPEELGFWTKWTQKRREKHNLEAKLEFLHENKIKFYHEDPNEPPYEGEIRQQVDIQFVEYKLKKVNEFFEEGYLNEIKRHQDTVENPEEGCWAQFMKDPDPEPLKKEIPTLDKDSFRELIRSEKICLLEMQLLNLYKKQAHNDYLRAKDEINYKNIVELEETMNRIDKCYNSLIEFERKLKAAEEEYNSIALKVNEIRSNLGIRTKRKKKELNKPYFMSEEDWEENFINGETSFEYALYKEFKQRENMFIMNDWSVNPLDVEPSRDDIAQYKANNMDYAFLCDWFKNSEYEVDFKLHLVKEALGKLRRNPFFIIQTKYEVESMMAGLEHEYKISYNFWRNKKDDPTLYQKKYQYSEKVRDDNDFTRYWGYF